LLITSSFPQKTGISKEKLHKKDSKGKKEIEEDYI